MPVRVLGMLTAEQRIASFVAEVQKFDPAGRGYFDRLDAMLQFDGDTHKAIVDKVLEEFGPRPYIIASGGFGIAHRDWSRSNRAGKLPLVLPGGLRYKTLPEYGRDTSEWRYRMQGVREAVFVDDSLYAGRTMNWVRHLVLMCGIRFAGTVVAYDGSQQKLDGVHSLYRYFDFHPLP